MKRLTKYSLLLLTAFLTFTFCFAQKSKEKKSGKYDFQGAYFNNRARVKQGLKWGFIDRNNALVVGLKYNEVENFNDGLAKVRKEHFWGLIDTTGREIIPIAFDWVGDFEGDRAKVTRLGQTVFIDRTGKIVGK